MAQVTLTCKQCKTPFIVLYKYRAKRAFCSRECRCKGTSGSGNPAFGRTYRTKETHPEWAAKVSETSSVRRINAGDKNGMKQLNARLKTSATRKRKFEEDPEFAAQHAAIMRNAWASGKFDGVAVGRCKWYDHTRPDGSVIKLQGTWEVALARHLDALGVSYLAHEGRWSYIDSNGAARSYYPDFHIVMWNVTIDVKGVFWDECGAEKFERVRASNRDVHLVVATRDILNSWGVDILSVEKELLMKKTIVTKRDWGHPSADFRIAQKSAQQASENPTYVRESVEQKNGQPLTEDPATYEEYLEYLNSVNGVKA